MKVHLIMIVLGLSPLARGTRVFSRRWLPMRRFIPAGAGNTPPCPTVWINIAVYPRWRGEHWHKFLSAMLNGGLSPLARGTLRLHQNPAPVLRFIPAGAGNTQRGGILPNRASVYPRWRGEHQRLTSAENDLVGLSPLARGTRPPTAIRINPRRFIPAGAGNTQPPQPPGGRSAVYPRWRGEH